MSAALEPVDWRAQAACAGRDTDLFYGADGRTGPRANETRAKRICGRCPVITECLTWAIRTGEPWGIWGGRTPAERGVPEAWHRNGARTRANARRLAARRDERAALYAEAQQALAQLAAPIGGAS
jgi:WhiB family redox-sensing transcriptional regulator